MKLHSLAPLLVVAACSKSPAPPGPIAAKPAAPAREDVEDPRDYHAARAQNVEVEVKDLASAAAFEGTPDGKAAAKRWAKTATYHAPGGGTHTLTIVTHEGNADENWVELHDETGARLARDEADANASAVEGRVAVLPNGHVLFEAAYLHGPISTTNVYTLTWDKAGALLVPDAHARYNEEM